MSWIEEQFIKPDRKLEELFSKKFHQFSLYEKYSMKIKDYNGIDCNLLTACSVIVEPPQMVAARYYRHNGLE